MNIPIAGTVICIIGHPHSTTGTDGSGMLILTVDDIVYNPGTAHILADSKEDTSNSSPRRFQARKRKRTGAGIAGKPYTLFMLIYQLLR